MRKFVISATLAGTAFCFYGAASRLTDDGLTVHEWGTFTSVAGDDGSPVAWNVLGCGTDLPHFVRVVEYKGAFAARVRMETPVVYFYSARDVDATVDVSFPGGRFTEVYPAAGNFAGPLEWSAVHVRPNAAAEFPVEAAPSRYYAARATDAAPLEVGGQHEKFLFYRGTADIPVPLSARVGDDGRITVAKTGHDAVPVVMLFENRGGAIGYRNAGSVDAARIVERPALDDVSASHIKADLERALVAQGLYPKEAAAMLETWRDSWFEEGSRLIYILPESAVNVMLPMRIQPPPARMSRVFVGRIELVTPETKHAVYEAAAKNDTRTLALYSRFLGPISRAIGKPVNLPCAADRQ